MNKFKKIDEMDSKRSELYDITYEIFEFMGETLDVPKNRFKKVKAWLVENGTSGIFHHSFFGLLFKL